MYYRVNENYALRAWKYVNNVVYNRYLPNPIRVDDDTFELLKCCDGDHDLPESEVLKNLMRQGIISPCRQGGQPSGWSKYRKYDHRFMPGINLMVTGKCNYNCRHCFNSSDNADRMQEWDYDALLDLLDQASDCGVHTITLTGGEPMLHPRFNDIVRAIYDRNMVLVRLLTNGHFLNEDTISLFKELKASPQIIVSFDGVGHHDWMRRYPGAEEDALRVFKLCASSGFQTRAQTQVHRRNIDSMKATLSLLESIGVRITRIIPTVPFPRWEKNAPGASLSVEEYFDRMLDLAEWYLKDGHTMKAVMWHYLALYPSEGRYIMINDRIPDGKYHPTAPVCYHNRTKMEITCEGKAVPCIQISDYAASLGQTYDSLKDRRLADILNDGEWKNAVCMNLHHLRKDNKECDACEWFNHCCGGCRALAIVHAGKQSGKYDYTAPDPIACHFFKGGWYDKVKERPSDFVIQGDSSL